MKCITTSDGESPLQLLRGYGNHELAFAALQKGVCRLQMRDIGFVAFRVVTVLGRTFRMVLGDPTCPLQHKEHVIRQFMNDSQEARHTVCWWQVSHSTGEILNRIGMSVEVMGCVTRLPLQDAAVSKLRGSAYSSLRRAFTLAKRAGCTFKDRNVDGDHQLFEELSFISKRWLSCVSKNQRDLGFLTYPVNGPFPAGCRIFMAQKENDVRAFAIYVPMFDNGEANPKGYYGAVLRSGDCEADKYRSALVASAIETFSREGVEFLSLGLSPFAEGSATSFRRNLVAVLIMRCLYYFGDWIYNFRGLSEHKRRYHGEQLQVYCALPALWTPAAFLGLCDVMGISLLRQAIKAFGHTAQNSNKTSCFSQVIA